MFLTVRTRIPKIYRLKLSYNIQIFSFSRVIPLRGVAISSSGLSPVLSAPL